MIRVIVKVPRHPGTAQIELSVQHEPLIGDILVVGNNQLVEVEQRVLYAREPRNPMELMCRNISAITTNWETA